MKKEKNDYSGFIEGILVISVSVYFYTLASRIGAETAYFGFCGPDRWPKIVLIGLMVAGLILVISSLKDMYVKSRGGQRQERSGGFEEEASRDYVESKIPFGIITFSVVYAIPVILIMGYALGTFIFQVFMMSLLLGIKKIKSLTLISLIWTISVLILFSKIFFVPLPKGMGIFYDMSVFLTSLLK